MKLMGWIGAIFLIGGVVLMVVSQFNIESHSEETKCYDRFSNEIKDMVCQEDYNTYFGIDESIFFVLTFMLGVLGAMFMMFDIVFSMIGNLGY